MEGEADVQRLLDKETNVLNEQLEQLEDKLEKAKRELKQKREAEETNQAEIDSLKNVKKNFSFQCHNIIRYFFWVVDDSV